MKFIFKILIIFAVFIISLFYFGGDITETLFSGKADTTDMSPSTFPIISMQVNGLEFNTLHGYASNLNEMVMRESITPLGSDRTFTVLIAENGCMVKKLQYEVLNENGQEIENGSMIILDSDTNRKSVRIQLQEPLKSGSEYVAKITLITNLSKRIYYYTRLKMYDNGHLTEKLEFVDYFHNTLLNRETADALNSYLEPSSKADASTFARIDIHSNTDLTSWGDLNPKVIYQDVPTINEFYDSMASVTLPFIVSIDTDNGIEYYTVYENYRFNYTEKRVYLYNYERHMEALFDVQNTSLSKNEFKLGITTDTNAQTGISENKKYICFVYGRELMLYDVESNTLTCVFSFRENPLDFSRNLYDNHEVRLLRVHDDGVIDFYVYGYMNRGEYEGRVGIVLYRYYHSDSRIEEQLYVPVNSTYQLLKSDMTDFAYLNGYDIFYFSLFDSIYSFSLITKELTHIASDVPKQNLILCQEEHYAAWQECSDNSESISIRVIDLEESKEITINADAGDNIRLYGRINNNIIYGFSKKSDTYVYSDGNTLVPSYKLLICNKKGEVLKEYEKPGYYITSIEAEGNILSFSRVKKKSGEGLRYEEASGDSILNRLEEVIPPVEITKRITDHMLTEYYISLPDDIEITGIPKYTIAANTIINYDTTIRVNEPKDRTKLYYAYSFGNVVFSSPRAAEVIKEADKYVGTVINDSGRLVWERGVKSSRTEIADVPHAYTSEKLDSMKASISMLLSYKNAEADAGQYDRTGGTVSQWMSRYMKVIPIDLTGCTLDEVLYYVYKKRPVIAVRNTGSACVITGYDNNGITVIDPQLRKTVKYTTKEAAEIFDNEHGRFISYVE